MMFMDKAMKRVWWLAGLLVLLVPWASHLRTSTTAPGLDEKASVFVLPFRNEGTNGVPDDLRGRERRV